MVFYDPTGERYGIPTYPYRMAPTGLATLRQLRNQNLRPGDQDVAAQLMWRKGKRVAFLYRIPSIYAHTDKVSGLRPFVLAQSQRLDGVRLATKAN